MTGTSPSARTLLVIAAAVLALATAVPCTAQEDPLPSLAQPNPDFADYLRSPQRLQTEAVGRFVPGLIPEPIDLSHADSMWALSDVPVVSLPTTYDLRPLGKLTPIRDQGSCGSCWDFASFGSLESSLMPAESWNLSENNLKNLAGFDIGCCSGGNRTMSTAYFARWGGPVSEADDPYNAGSCYSPIGLPARRHVQEVIFLPRRTSALDNDALKQAVMTYGAVYTAYYHSNAYYNSATRAYYMGSGTNANHAVCIVGWDDSFASSKFLTPPPGNGAFLIRNSWGAWWGDAGYFWMSYYDAVLGKTENGFFRAEANNYDTIYQYDTLGWIGSTGYGGTTAWFANVFTATSGSPIVAASWYTASPNCTYDLYVYRDPTSGPVGSPVAAANTGMIATMGYHTVALDAPVPVAVGQRFSVVVKLNTPGYGYPVPLERPYGGYSSRATAGPGQSYMSSTGTSWIDVAAYYANTNVCLKAFGGSGTTPPPPGSLSVTPSTGLTSSGNAGGPFSPASATFTLTNTGGSSISWAASKGQAWVSLSVSSGTLAAGASTSVTASIDSTANGLGAGSYSDTVSFTNATNGSGNTSRPVSLAVNNAPTPGTLSVTPSAALTSSGDVGGPFSPVGQTYTLTNTGGSPISWAASKGQAWVSLSASSGALPAGASASVTVTINSTANGLDAGSYSDVVALVNTTNGAGNTSRGVSLTVSPTAPPPTGAYRVVPAAFSWINPASHPALNLSDDNFSYYQNLPFSFTYFGRAYSRLLVGSNGLLGFDMIGLYSSANVSIPAAGYPNAVICPYWDNLNPAVGGRVSAGTIGYAPYRKYVVSWVGVPHKTTAGRFSFQAILEESTNDIVFQYLDVSPSNMYGAGRSATIGIENETGTQGCLFSYNSTKVSNNTAIRFTTAP